MTSLDVLVVDKKLKAESLKSLFKTLYDHQYFQKLGMTDNHLNSIKKGFTNERGEETLLSHTDGIKWLEQAKVPGSLRAQYWRALTRGDPSGGLDFWQYVVGICASNPQTPHEGIWRRIRNNYIFSAFDTNLKRELDAVEFRILVYSIMVLQNKV